MVTWLLRDSHWWLAVAVTGSDWQWLMIEAVIYQALLKRDSLDSERFLFWLMRACQLFHFWQRDWEIAGYMGKLFLYCIYNARPGHTVIVTVTVYYYYYIFSIYRDYVQYHYIIIIAIIIILIILIIHSFWLSTDLTDWHAITIGFSAFLQSSI